MFGDKNFGEIAVSRINRRDSSQRELVLEAILKSLIGAFDDTFGLTDTGGFDLDAKILAGIRKLGKGILGIIFHLAIAIIKDRTVIGFELERDTVVGKDLMKDVVITVEGFLPVEETADDGAGGVVDGEMQDGFTLTEPEMEGTVHLDFLTEIFAALLAWMCVSDGDLLSNGVDDLSFRGVRMSRQVFDFSQLFSGSATAFRRNEAVVGKDPVDRCVRNGNAFTLFQ